MSELETHNIDPSSTSPGAILKRCREYHDITLEEAEEATKIGANYLQALEDDQISQFASVAYLKGFLRIYTTYLGLNPDDMIRMYDKLYSSGNKKHDHKSNTGAGGDSTPRKKFPLQKLYMPVIIMVLIIITAAIINRSASTPPRKNPQTVTAAPVAIPAVQPMRSSTKPPQPATKADESESRQQLHDPPPALQNRIQPSPIESSKSFIARMKVTQSGTLTVTIDGSTSQNYDLVAGDSIEWKANHGIIFELSNSGGVEVELNGKPLKPFGQPGKPAVIELDAEGFKQ